MWRAVGGGTQSGGVGGKLAYREAVAGVGHDRDRRGRGGAAGEAAAGVRAPRAKPAGRPRGGEAEVRVAAEFGGGGR